MVTSVGSYIYTKYRVCAKSYSHFHLNAKEVSHDYWNLGVWNLRVKRDLNHNLLPLNACLTSEMTTQPVR